MGSSPGPVDFSSARRRAPDALRHSAPCCSAGPHTEVVEEAALEGAPRKHPPVWRSTQNRPRKRECGIRHCRKPHAGLGPGTVETTPAWRMAQCGTADVEEPAPEGAAVRSATGWRMRDCPKNHGKYGSGSRRVGVPPARRGGRSRDRGTLQPSCWRKPQKAVPLSVPGSARRDQARCQAPGYLHACAMKA